MLFSLTEFELLRGTNAVSQQHGGYRVGQVGSVYAWQDHDTGELVADATGWTYRNQWLISVELVDDASPFGGEVAPGDHLWKIRSGYCQTNITRTPGGGFGLEIPSALLSLAPTVGHIQDLFKCQFGKSDERQHKLDLWLSSVRAWRAERAPILVAMNAIAREAALSYSLREGLLE